MLLKHYLGTKMTLNSFVWHIDNNKVHVKVDGKFLHKPKKTQYLNNILYDHYYKQILFFKFIKKLRYQNVNFQSSLKTHIRYVL
jgi:hypothetical protein